MKVFVIVPAAGLGTRMGPTSVAKTKKRPPAKQFKELGGIPILIHTLRKFVACPEVYEIIVALRKNEIAGFRAQLEKQYPEILNKRLQIVEGGEHRQDSVASALAAVAADSDDIVLVHDGVRPFVTPEIIAEVIAAARKHGAAIAGMPAMDTVKQVERTAEGALIKRAGHPVAVVMGSPRNLKITTPADMELAEFYLKESA